MAEKLELVRTYDFQSDQGTVSLLSLTDGFDVAYEGWTPETIPDRDGRIRESITVRAQGTSTDHLASKLQGLVDKKVEAQRWFNNMAEDYAVWFRVQLDGETEPRQALVYGIEHQAAISIYSVAARQKWHLNKYKIGVERDPWWEATTAGTIASGTMSVWGGTFGYSGINGDLPARMASVKVARATSTGTPTYDSALFNQGEFWLGWRSNTYGTAISWVPYSRCWDPTHYGMSSFKGTVDAYALAGTAGTVIYNSFESSQNVDLAFYLKMSDLTANHLQMAGKFKVLARVKANHIAGGLQNDQVYQYNVRMASLFNYDDATSHESYIGTHYSARSETRWHPSIPLLCGNGSSDYYDYPGGAYHIYDMGEVEWPPIRKGIFAFDNFALAFYAEEVANPGGTANVDRVHWDTIFFLPTGEGYYHGGRSLNHPGYGYTGAGTVREYYGYHAPDGGDYGLLCGTIGGTVYEDRVDTAFTYQGVPAGSGIGVFVYNPTGAQADLIYGGSMREWRANVTVRTVERWEALRGND
jgi:hypothetical protein